LHPMQVRYQAALHADKHGIIVCAPDPLLNAWN